MQAIGDLSPKIFQNSHATWRRGSVAVILKPLDKRQCLTELGKKRLFGFERRGVHATAQAAHPDGMLQVKHLVIEQVLDGVARTGRPVENAADDNRVVRRVVVPKRPLGVVLAPGKFRPSEQAAEEAQVQRVENFLEVVEPALWAEVALGAACMANELGLSRDGGRRSKSLIAQALRGFDRFFVE